jgi:hypothetical protein
MENIFNLFFVFICESQIKTTKNKKKKKLKVQ